ALRHRQQCIPSELGVSPALERGRRRTQKHGNLFHLGALYSHVTRVVARDRRLLERGLVLFVDDDETQPPGWGEYRRPNSYDDLNFARGNALPVTMTLGIGEVTVKYRDIAVTFAESLDSLWGQADLGYEHDHLAPQRDNTLDRREIDLGLAATGD